VNAKTALLRAPLVLTIHPETSRISSIYLFAESA
jgi:hypothetical protein